MNVDSLEVFVVSLIVGVEIFEVIHEVFDGRKVEHVDEGVWRCYGRVVSEAEHHRNHVMPVRGKL